MGSILSSLASVRKKFSDTFNRPNQTGLGTASDGSTWQSLNGGFDIENSKAKGVSTAYPIAAIDFPQKNVSIDLAGISQGSSAALWVTDSGNWWAVGIDQVPVTCNCGTCADIVGYGGGNCADPTYPYEYCSGYYTEVFTCNVYYPITSACNGGYNAITSACNGGYNAINSTCNSYNTRNSFCSYQYYTTGNCKGYNAYNAKNKTGGNCTGYNSVAVCGVYGNSGGTCAAYSNGGGTCAGYTNGGGTCKGYTNGGGGCQYGTISGGNCISAWNNYNCGSYYATYAIYGEPYSCNCQTCYPQYIRIMQSVGSTVSQIASWAISGVAQSLRVKTSGDQITIKAYSDPSLITQIDGDMVYTPTGAAVNSKFGIAIKPSTYNQGYTIDQVNIDKN